MSGASPLTFLAISDAFLHISSLKFGTQPDFSVVLHPRERRVFEMETVSETELCINALYDEF